MLLNILIVQHFYTYVAGRAKRIAEGCLHLFAPRRTVAKLSKHEKIGMELIVGISCRLRLGQA